MKRTRFLIEDNDGEKGSTTGFLTTFHNAMNQERQVAFDGRKWFVQESNNKPFKEIGEDWLPEELVKRMAAFMVEHRKKLGIPEPTE